MSRSTAEARPLTASRPRALPGLALQLLLLLTPALAAADGGAALVRDIDLTREPYFPPCHVLCPPTPPIAGSLVADLMPFGDRILFGANDRVHGFTVWISDGTAEGTLRLNDPATPSSEAPAIPLGTAGSSALFWATESANELWITDGTPGGTEPLPMPCGAACQAWDDRRGWLAEGQLFFNAYDGGAQHIKLYRFDPASRTVHEVFDGCADRPGSFCLRDVLELVSWSGEIYFNLLVQGSGSAEARLHRIDAPEGDPSPVPGACSWSSSLLPLGSQLLFAGNCGGAASARSLFALDAPGAAPRLVRAFTAAGRLTAWGSERVAFTEGSALWITDGTTGGTVEAGFESAASFVPFGELLLVNGQRGGTSGLWVLHPGGAVELLRAGTVLQGPGVAGGLAYFGAAAPGLGVELWATDGTPAGTRLYQDLAPGADSSNPGDGGLESTGFVAAGERVYFAATDPLHDTELWSAPLDATPPPGGCAPGTETLCIGGRFAVEVDWTLPGRAGRGRAVPLAGDTGAFWFFDASNLELMVKVLDGRAVNGRHWVFFGALTDVAFTLVVTDTRTGQTWTHANPAGHFASGADTDAFPE